MPAEKLFSDWIRSYSKNDGFSKDHCQNNNNFTSSVHVDSEAVVVGWRGYEGDLFASGKTTCEQRGVRFGGCLARRGWKRELILNITLKQNHKGPQTLEGSAVALCPHKARSPKFQGDVP